jgi:peptidoglycan L-alanyl-D-glutamate endopeptidase CwlK
MPYFGERSRKNLSTCHPDLLLLSLKVIKEIDFAVIEGHRGEARQNILAGTGKSKVIYPKSYHNTWPSLALDYIPWPFDATPEAWEDEKRFKKIADIFKETAIPYEIELLWGGDWRGLHDLGHIQLMSKNFTPYEHGYKVVDE